MLANSVNGVNTQRPRFGAIQKTCVITGKSVAKRGEHFIDNFLKRRKPGTDIATFHPDHARSEMGVIVYTKQNDLWGMTFKKLKELPKTIMINLNKTEKKA